MAVAEIPGRVRPLLAERDFSLLLAAQLLAQCADGIAQAAFVDRILLEPATQGTPGRMLGVAALTLLPYSLISPFLGVFVDRWARRELLVWTNVGRAAMLVTFPIWAPLLPGVGALFAAILLLLGFGRLFLVTKGAALPVVLRDRHLLDGNSVSVSGGMIAGLLGGVIGIAAVGAFDPGVVLTGGGVVYGISAFTSRRISHPMGHAEPALERFVDAIRRIALELVEGLRRVWRSNAARLPLAGIFILRTAAMITVFAAILVIRELFPPSSGDRFGMLSTGAAAVASAGVGAFVGAVIAPALGRRLNRSGLILFGFAVSGLAIVSLGGVANIPALVALTFLGGVGGFVAKVATDAQVQSALPDELRGRAFSLYDILYNAASVAAALVIVVFQGASLRVLLPVCGLVTLFLAALLGVAMRRTGLLGASD